MGHLGSTELRRRRSLLALRFESVHGSAIDHQYQFEYTFNPGRPSPTPLCSQTAKTRSAGSPLSALEAMIFLAVPPQDSDIHAVLTHQRRVLIGLDMRHDSDPGEETSGAWPRLGRLASTSLSRPVYSSYDLKSISGDAL
ncbi:hypothetical protein EXIGLDRAFT_112037 [Exidia glandulosa HHB12029]|uniref:Uncharacterized protein n=1 Tax=Exidia glandulosa HHB12029 TaxID=1314781 RepID=A0A166BGM4_EXIGL|nr:hypothetical protein EXIGLDRAFT_112037 [Exidia glandulosa HHB12029]